MNKHEIGKFIKAEVVKNGVKSEFEVENNIDAFTLLYYLTLDVTRFNNTDFETTLEMLRKINNKAKGGSR